jgi:hypothetical protein
MICPGVAAGQRRGILEREAGEKVGPRDDGVRAGAGYDKDWLVGAAGDDDFERASVGVAGKIPSDAKLRPFAPAFFLQSVLMTNTLSQRPAVLVIMAGSDHLKASLPQITPR